MNKTICIYISEEDSKNVDFSLFENVIMFPDKGKTYADVMNIARVEDCTIVVSSPIVCTNYKIDELYVYKNDRLETLDESLYGASLDVAIKILHRDVKSMMSSYIIEEIRSKLKEECALEYIKSLADSMEKAYLIKVLERERKDDRA